MTKTRPYAPEAARFTTGWWLGGARNLFFIAVISILIWVYADMEVTKDESFRATIELTGGSSEDLVLGGPEKVPVSFKLRGSRRALAEFRRDLEQKQSRLSYDVCRRHDPGENSVRTEEILNYAAELSKYSLSVVSALPARVGFILDYRVRQTAKVVLDAKGGLTRNTPKIEPSEIVVRLAKSDLDAIRTQQNLSPGDPIRLKTRSVDLREFPTGEEHSRQVDVLPPPTRFPVILEPSSVLVTLKIDQRMDERPFQVTVRVVSPHTWPEDGTWKEYRMVKKDPLEWRPQIAVSGPEKDLARLRPEDIDAQVALTEEDKTPVKSWLPRKITVHFPLGMDLRLIGDPPTVHFKFEKLPPSPAPVTQ